jgi:GalNAc-alpha-(1->4)-GalNAc-alpha-(1->3)-diNAcBac-PP-undecaprenol alpha-1,4-N-acetyl-D-galactosaminyltransferase
MNLKSENKKICLIIPSLAAGGQEMVLTELANFLNKKGYEVHIIFLIKLEIFYNLNKNIICHFPNYGYKKNLIYKITYRINSIFHIRKKLKNINPISVFSLPQGYNNLTLIANLGLKFPVFVSDRSSPTKPLDKINQILRKKLYTRAKGIIAQTNFAKIYFKEEGINNKNILVIPNPLRPLKEKSKIDIVLKKRIVSLGRLIESKKFDVLIEIFHEINDPNWELFIFGDGPEREKLELKIKSLGIENSVFLPGKIKNIEVEFDKSEIFAFTSISEGFPNALSEALAYPLACIAYDCIAGPRDLINDGINGLLIPNENRVIFREKLCQLMQSAKLRDTLMLESIKGRKLYDTEKVCQQYHDFITRF